MLMSDGLTGAASILTRTSFAPVQGSSASSILMENKTHVNHAFKLLNLYSPSHFWAALVQTRSGIISGACLFFLCLCSCFQDTTLCSLLAGHRLTAQSRLNLFYCVFPWMKCQTKPSETHQC